MEKLVKKTFSHGGLIGFVSIEFLLNELGNFGVPLVFPKSNGRLL